MIVATVLRAMAGRRLERQVSEMGRRWSATCREILDSGAPPNSEQRREIMRRNGIEPPR